MQPVKLEGITPEMPLFQKKAYKQFGMCVFTKDQLDILGWDTKQIIINAMEYILKNNEG